MARKRPTQAEVAALAGVSSGTVSIVLNAQNSRIPISEETRKRVLDAAQQLKYAPNPLAQMLVKGSSCMIGVFTYEPIFPISSTDFYYQYLIGIEQEATLCDYNLLLFTRGRTGSGNTIYGNGINALAIADGALLLGPRPDRDELRRLYEEGYPFVFIGRREVPGCQIDWITSDVTTGVADATQYLLGLGHRRIAFLVENPEFESTTDRLLGFHRAMNEEISASSHLIYTRDQDIPLQIEQLIKKDGITAILCQSITNSYALLEQFSRAGLSVPGDISILCTADGGSDSHSPIQITHLNLNREEVGKMALRALLKRMEGAELAPQAIAVACELVEGNTCAKPNA